jgi:predicted alpha/beta hydrolase
VDVTRVAAADGYPLGATLHGPEDDVAPLIVIASATGVRRRYYAAFAAHLAARGMRALTFDYRGIGDSRPASLRGFHATMREWGSLDLEGVLRWAASRSGGRPVGFVGHSVGGQLLGQAPSNTIVDRALFVAAQHGWFRHWPVARWPLLAGLWYGAVPALSHALGFFPAPWLGLGEALPKSVALMWSSWCTQRHAMPGPPNGPLRERFAQVKAASHSLSIADDTLAPRAAADALLEFYPGAVVSRQELEPRALGRAAIGHFGYFRAAVASTQWDEAVEYLVARDAPRPSNPLDASAVEVR